LLRVILIILALGVFGLVVYYGSKILPLNGLTDTTDYRTAQTIPRYPNATSWKVSASNGFPDGTPNGEIDFVTTDDAGKKLPGRYIGFKKNNDTVQLDWRAKTPDDRNYRFSVLRIKS
jgi:hypothetical protein